MKNHSLSLSIILVSLFFIFTAPSFVYADMDITAYYPAPYGEYQQIKFTPTEQVSMPACNSSIAGVMLFNSTAAAMQYCDGTQWRNLGSGDEYWVLSSPGSNLMPIATNYKVTVGTQASETADIGTLVIRNRHKAVQDYTQFDNTDRYNHIRGNTVFDSDLNDGGAGIVAIGPWGTNPTLYADGGMTINNKLNVGQNAIIYGNLTMGADRQMYTGGDMTVAANEHLYLNPWPGSGNVNVLGAPGYVCLFGGGARVCREKWAGKHICVEMTGRTGKTSYSCTDGTGSVQNIGTDMLKLRVWLK